MINVVSFSGGRTSAYLVYLMEQRRKQGEDVRYVFMDTGAEHPFTYKFVRNVVNFWDIPLVVLQADINPQLGASNGYIIWEPKDIQTRMPILKPFTEMVKKYGTPYIGGAFCTDRLKLRPFRDYCNDHFGRGNYQTWIGIRADEPRRLTRKDGVSYLADISDFDKQDILDWWKGQLFDLTTPEHLGNCMFCIKKSSKKLGLACQDEPMMKRVFEEYCIKGKHVRDGHRKTPKEIMYRGNLSLDGIARMYSNTDYQNLYREMVAAKQFDTGSCSESCEIF
ncbi:phosphoadenosine phosphosulfate reductase domain-containing protein [Xenorhabdus taiwanensis]|uniref:Phosphoadenosine phosphosulfate reductase family protein n=1 Tax=Xenorhabdus taiwanensis TaxID=3085177 RepID=A0ABM8JYF5_9GAMM|nr:phosphoadenosine phosphosulfate reductase family protein [Xenorhabdus sp. TCT-1]BET97340.1 phosphoadenosine phosphosulfate reductase family protein [Xenorhabdus sp. TCT-1]BET97747.1 phosphoadenosine phosphosulfate reductase family protein [Xenorhabdus sp. TCT-1]